MTWRLTFHYSTYSRLTVFLKVVRQLKLLSVCSLWYKALHTGWVGNYECGVLNIDVTLSDSWYWATNLPNCLVYLWIKGTPLPWNILQNCEVTIIWKNLISVVLSLTVLFPALRLYQQRWSHWGDTSHRLIPQLSSATMIFWLKTSSTTIRRVRKGHAH